MARLWAPAWHGGTGRGARSCARGGWGGASAQYIPNTCATAGSRARPPWACLPPACARRREVRGAGRLLSQNRRPRRQPSSPYAAGAPYRPTGAPARRRARQVVRVGDAACGWARTDARRDMPGASCGRATLWHPLSTMVHVAPAWRARDTWRTCSASTTEGAKSDGEPDLWAAGGDDPGTGQGENGPRGARRRAESLTRASRRTRRRSRTATCRSATARWRSSTTTSRGRRTCSPRR